MLLMISRVGASIRCHAPLAAVLTEHTKRSLFSLAATNRSCSWTPRLLRHGDLDRLLPWGFIDQTTVLRVAIPSLTRMISEARGYAFDPDSTETSSAVELQSVLGDLRRWIQEKAAETRVGAGSFHLAGTSHSEFVRGVPLAYRSLADLWSGDRALRPESAERLATPALADLLCQVHEISRAEHAVRPRLTIEPREPILALVIKVEIEEGRAHKPGQIFGRWDRDEMLMSLLEGAAGPEAQLLRQRDSFRRSQMTGSDPHAHIPHRLVAHTLFLAREKYECLKVPSSRGDKDEGTSNNRQSQECDTGIGIGTFPLQCHIWEFETDVGVSLASGEDVGLQWRVRNINSALKPRAGRVLKSDGIFESGFGKWVY